MGCGGAGAGGGGEGLEAGGLSCTGRKRGGRNDTKEAGYGYRIVSCLRRWKRGLVGGICRGRRTIPELNYIIRSDWRSLVTLVFVAALAGFESMKRWRVRSKRNRFIRVGIHVYHDYYPSPCC